MAPFWRDRMLMPNAEWCSICEASVRVYIVTGVSGAPVVPRLALCGLCDCQWTTEPHSPSFPPERVSRDRYK